ncbi:MAG: hypothetical protein M2R45_03718 [Verrucomicrobia subdivision 3 bacterium]|nr:hypothetical protein [Limisphaerales bacterium]MCS1416958.1 hypothetical protein [Limisphaerales bacterium]
MNQGWRNCTVLAAAWNEQIKAERSGNQAVHKATNREAERAEKLLREIKRLAFPTQAKQQHEPNRLPQWIVLVGLVLVILLHLFVFSPERQAKRVVKEWLTEQKKGRSGEHLWKDGIDRGWLFAVRDWEIQDVSVDDIDGNARVRVRIESSTKGGSPIVKDWTVWLDKVDGKWKISDF